MPRRTERTLQVPIGQLTPGATQPQARVFVRKFWDEDWVEEDYLRVESIRWAVSPSMPVAQLTWRYGEALRPGGIAKETVEPKDILGWYVKIEFGIHVWVGTIEIEGDRDLGRALSEMSSWTSAAGDEMEEADGEDLSFAATSTKSGRQTYVAYGMEFQLHYTFIKNCAFCDAHDNVYNAEAGLVFNEDHKPNMSKEDHTVAVDRDSRTFTDRWLREKDSDFWSTREIVRYLVAAHNPIDNFNTMVVPWNINSNQLDKLPNWDKPVVDTEGRRFLDVLNQVVSRYRLLGWSASYGDIANEMNINIHTYAVDDLAMPSSEDKKIAANGDLYDITTWDADGNGSPHVQSRTLQINRQDVIDQVRVQGANRVTVMAVSHEDGTLLPGWSSDEESQFESAGGIPGNDIAEARERAHAYRTQDSMEHVFSRFLLKPDIEPTGDTYKAYRRSLMSNLPFKGRTQYSTGLDGEFTGDGSRSMRDPFALIKIPGSSPSKYLYTEKLSAATEVPTFKHEDDQREWTATVQVFKNDWAIRILVSGDQQNIAMGGAEPGKFAPVVPRDEQRGEWTWQDMVVLVAWEDERRCEAVYPELANIEYTVDSVRELVIDVGDQYKLIYVPPGTPYDIDPASGQLLKTPASGGFMQDDRELLQDLAYLAWEWYSKDRRAIEIQCGYHSALNYLTIGGMVVRFDDWDVNAMITELELDFQVAEQESPADEIPCINWTMKTAYHELDVMKI